MTTITTTESAPLEQQQSLSPPPPPVEDTTTTTTTTPVKAISSPNRHLSLLANVDHDDDNTAPQLPRLGSRDDISLYVSSTLADGRVSSVQLLPKQPITGIDLLVRTGHQSNGNGMQMVSSLSSENLAGLLPAPGGSSDSLKSLGETASGGGGSNMRQSASSQQFAHICVNLKDLMWVRVKALDSSLVEREHQVLLNDEGRVADLKDRLSEMTGVERSRQQLLGNGQPLQDELLISELPSGMGSTVFHLVVRKSAKVRVRGAAATTDDLSAGGTDRGSSRGRGGKGTQLMELSVTSSESTMSLREKIERARGVPLAETDAVVVHGSGRRLEWNDTPLIDYGIEHGVTELTLDIVPETVLSEDEEEMLPFVGGDSANEDGLANNNNSSSSSSSSNNNNGSSDDNNTATTASIAIPPPPKGRPFGRRLSNGAAAAAAAAAAPAASSESTSPLFTGRLHRAVYRQGSSNMSTDSPPSDNTPPSSAGPSSPSTARSPSTLSHAGSLSHALRQAQIGLSNGYQPSLSKAGTGGAYFLKGDGGKVVAVFKPEDEEPLARNNPRRRERSGGNADDDSGVGVPGRDDMTFSGSSTSMLSQSWSGGGMSILGGRMRNESTVEGLKRGSRVGDGAANEVAAYLIDHGGRAGVPATALVNLRCSAAGAGSRGGVKRGALQEFVHSVGDAEEISPSLFLTQDVHGIAILDMRIAQCDRHGGNVLVVDDSDVAFGSGSVSDEGGSSAPNSPLRYDDDDDNDGMGNFEKWIMHDRSSMEDTIDGRPKSKSFSDNKGRYRLVPIDNGYAFPASLADLTFEWAWWPQANEPFSKEDLEYIAALDSEVDLALLSRHGLPLRPACAHVVRTCTTCLKVCAAHGMTPADIAGVMQREFGGRSPLEKLSKRALQVSASEMSEGSSDHAAYVSALTNLLEEYCAEMHA